MAVITQASSDARSAHATIKGYEYQFDRTALEILAAGPVAVVHVEGIEDVDLIEPDASQATQVKYYEAQRYMSPKSLRGPVKLMLDHYRTGARWSYVIHVHFGEPGQLPTELTLEELKVCLTKRIRATGGDEEYFTGLDDDALEDFRSRLSIRSGQTFDVQQRTLTRELALALGCDDDEVDAIYLAKARDFVHERARNADTVMRQCSRADLMAFLNVRELLFSRWQLAALGRERYIRAQVKHLKRSGFTDPKRIRAVLMELDEENFNTALDIVKELAGAHLGRLKNAKPWSVILGGAPELVSGLKVELVREGIHFNEGYESIEFSADAFNTPPIVNLTGGSDRIKSSSYVLRVLAEGTLQAHLAQIPKLARLIVLSEKTDWHDSAADQSYVLKEYEPGLLRALIGAVA